MTTAQAVNTVSVQPIGGPTALLEIGGLRLVVDPTFDEPHDYTGEDGTDGLPLVRTEGPARSIADIGTIDVALVSHDHHVDNLDRSGREVLANVATVLTTGVGAERLGGGAQGLDDYASVDLDLPAGGSITIHGVPAHHGPEGIWQAIGPVTGFVITGDVPTTYISGDNSSLDVVREIAQRFPGIELAVLFVGGAGFEQVADGVSITLTNDEALAVSEILDDAVIVPVHHDSWTHFREDAAALTEVFARANAADRLQVVARGESHEFPAQQA
ncbi:MAG: MBL fold metallo-hydrolase [Gordonia sp. (in: high G+C Gram-positive bacteria)]|uniref:MBL fold metallo-hydrolase n=1 Tax=Gordonia sp. (in: high G+C Gram-positive bacteria) TaxID=84139 RepID=UPI0039E638A1